MWAKQDFPWCRMEKTRPATLTGPAPRSSSSGAASHRAWSGPAQCDTGKRVPNGSTPASRRARSFSSRRRISSLRGTSAPVPSPGPPGGVADIVALPPPLEQERLDERIDVTVHDRVHVPDLDVGPVVLDQLIGR